jgi:hypothetical protein
MALSDRYYACAPVAYPGRSYDSWQVVDGKNRDGRHMLRLRVGLDEDQARRIAAGLNDGTLKLEEVRDGADAHDAK